MNFRPNPRDEPEINLIPFIDVLLVILIFLMLSTTYSKFTELQVILPTADAAKQRDYPREVIVAVSSDGRYMINRVLVEGRSAEALGAALGQASKAGKDSVVIISGVPMAARLPELATTPCNEPWAWAPILVDIRLTSEGWVMKPMTVRGMHRNTSAVVVLNA